MTDLTPVPQRGSALVTVLLAVAVLAVLAAGTLSLATAATRSSRHWQDRLAALYAAESGLNHALYRLLEGDRPTSLTSDPTIMGDPGPSYQVTISYDGNRATVTARGRSADGASTRTLQIVVTLAGAGCLFDDAYDAHSTANPPADGLIACDNPDNGPPCTALTVDATVVDQCPGTCPDGTLEVPREGNRMLAPGTYRFERLRVKEKGRLVVNGPATIYVDGYLQLDKKASLLIQGGEVTFLVRGEATGWALEAKNESAITVDASARATFRLQGDVAFGNESVLTTGGPTELYIYGKLDIGSDARVGTDPALLAVYLDTTTDRGDVSIKEDATFQGGLYAPTREVELKNGTTVTGAIVGRSIDLRRDATVTYDPAAGTGAGGAGCTGGGVSPGSWAPL